MTHTILVGDGTTSILILLAAMRELRACGRGERVSAVLVGAQLDDMEVSPSSSPITPILSTTPSPKASS